MDPSNPVWLAHPAAFSAPECCSLYCCRYPHLVPCTDHDVHDRGLPLLHDLIGTNSYTQTLPTNTHQTASIAETEHKFE